LRGPRRWRLCTGFTQDLADLALQSEEEGVHAFDRGSLFLGDLTARVSEFLPHAEHLLFRRHSRQHFLEQDVRLDLLLAPYVRSQRSDGTVALLQFDGCPGNPHRAPPHARSRDALHCHPRVRVQLLDRTNVLFVMTNLATSLFQNFRQ